MVLSVDAENDANISAINNAQTSGGGKAAGIVLAFNTIGLASSNFLFNTIDTLLGTDLLVGQNPLTTVNAYVQDSTLTGTDGSVSITGSKRQDQCADHERHYLARRGAR